MELNIDNYLQRISFLDIPKVDQNTLAALHKGHIQNVPFENLDIQLGNKIRLDLEEIQEKIVKNRRGGFCYELNSLFCALLQQLGFDVKMISGRVCGDGKFGHEFDHMVLLVNLDGEWLADVGFGDNFLEPIRIAVGVKQQDPSGKYAIVKHDSTYLRLQSEKDDHDSSPKYLFSRIGRRLNDFTEMCEYHQTSPQSSFTQGRICTLATKNGRITLRDRCFIETIDGDKTVREISTHQEFNQILRDRFGMVV